MGKANDYYQEQEIEMEQKSLNLKQQALTNNYELERLKKSIALDREEFQMGVKSKAQLQVAEDEYNYKLKTRHCNKKACDMIRLLR